MIQSTPSLSDDSNLTISLPDLVDLSCGLLRLIVQLLSQLLLLLHLSADILCLGLCDVVWLEGEVLLFETG